MKRRLPTVAESPLPTLYARWMDELLGGPLPSETVATCDDCAMRPEAGGAAADATYFDEATKCCTYQPLLPSFLVGSVLADAGAPARARIEEDLAARVGVTPLGIVPPRGVVTRYKALELGAFGRQPELRCSYHQDDGRCGIWRHRSAVCSTWFCKHVRGARGRHFWRDGVEGLLAAVERALAQHCLEVSGVDHDVLDALLVPLDALESIPYAKRWGTWVGRERELFGRAAAIAFDLDWKDVARICGPEIRLRATRVRGLYERLVTSSLPKALRVGTFQVVAASAERLRVVTYSPYDPIDLPAELLECLHAFDGRPTRRALAAIRKEKGVELDDAFVGELVDFGIVVAAD